MKVLKKGITKDGTLIQIEEWNENYNFLPYGNTIASYPKSKISLEGEYSPKQNKTYRIELNFNSNEMAEKIFNDLEEGKILLSELKEYINDKRYIDCI